MTFKLYQDKSSVLKKNSRYVQGGDTEVFPKSLGWWEERTDILVRESDDLTFYVTTEYERRADKIAYFVYGRNDLEWLVLQYNKIVDINEQLLSGVTLVLPSQNRVFTEILTKNIKYQAQQG